MQPAILEHASPGRIRLRFPHQRGNAQFFDQLVRMVRQHPSVVEADANPRTGSLLIRHTSTLDELGRAAVEMGLITKTSLARFEQRRRKPLSPLKAFVRQAPSNGPLLLLAGLSAVRILRGRVAGPASEHFWHAYIMWERRLPLVALTQGMLGLVQASRGIVLGSASSLIVYGIVLKQMGTRRGPSAGTLETLEVIE